MVQVSIAEHERGLIDGIGPLDVRAGADRVNLISENGWFGSGRV
jgi:hypothetical protein